MIQSDECLFKRSKSEYTDILGCTGTWERHMRTPGEGSHLYSKTSEETNPGDVFQPSEQWQEGHSFV